MKKKVVSLALALVMAIALFPVSVFAEEEEFTIKEGKSFSSWEQNYYGYAPQDRILVKYNGAGGDVVVPEGITIIEREAFLDCNLLTNVTLPDSLIEIRDKAFENCIRLIKISIPSHVNKIGSYAFQDCQNLEEVILPDSLTEIGVYAFWKCYKLKKVNLPDNLILLGQGAFASCESLVNIIIPSSITVLDTQVFSGCKNLSNVAIPKGITKIGREAFTWCNKDTIDIPGSVHEISEGAFRLCQNLTAVYVENGTTDIGAEAFSGCINLVHITIPESVTFIGKDAFAYCSSDLTIHGIPGSYAEIYAKENGISFVAVKQSPQPEIPPVTSYTATPTNDALTVDGVSQVPTAYKIGGANYFQLRDVAMMLNGTKAQFSVDYDSQRKAVVITTGQAYAPLGTELSGAAQGNAEAIIGNNDIYINGEKIDFEVYKIGGANFFQIRALGQALGFNVGWTQREGMYIESDKLYDPNN